MTKFADGSAGGSRRVTGRRGGAANGLTLLELMLALALTAVLLGLIGMAVDVHLRMLDSRQAEVEQTQLGRAILARIAQDLRNAVPPSASASDMASIDELADGATDSLLDSGLDMSALDDAASDLGLDASGLDTSALDATSISDAATLPATPGLYGNQFELQVDVSRLPRVDEYQQLLLSDEAFKIHDIPSDVKTVAYYLRSSGTTTMPVTQSLTDELNQFGLVRRVLDRQVTQYAVDVGNISSLDDFGEVLAPEVTAIEFQYFDGTQWLTEWDSEEMGGLPLAVKITLSMLAQSSAQATPQSFLSASAGAVTEPQERIVSLVVRIPVAQACSATTSDAVSAEGLDAVGL